MKLVTPAKDGQLTLDMDDVVVRGMTVSKDGELLWPPPPVQVSAVPAVVAPPPPLPVKVAKKPNPTRNLVVLALCGAALLALFTASPPPFLGHFMVFMLSVVIGYYVIGNVHHALHTPLMSVTNAISGIIVVGALLQVGAVGANVVVTVLAFLGILLASINVFGGFTVTQRMLAMFRRA
jgi:NAD(P) transhydrogenase subunit alpha